MAHLLLTAKLIFTLLEAERGIAVCMWAIYKNHSKKSTVNVICVCRYAEIKDWPTTYSRVSIIVKTAGQVMFLGHAPDLDGQWRTVIETESLPFTLQDMLAMKQGSGS